MYNPVAYEQYINSIPGRYDNLPRTTNCYKDPSGDLTAADIAKFDYAGQEASGSIFERQWHVLTPHETPASYGLAPLIKKSTGVMLRDSFIEKPQKRGLLQEEMFAPAGDPRPSQDTRLGIELMNKRAGYARQTSKTMSGSGALNGATLDDNHLNLPTSLGGPTRGFSNGAIKTPRYGGLHPRQRIIQVAESRAAKRPGIQHRTTNASSSFGAIGPVTAGMVRHATNADVREWGREPMPQGGIFKGIGPMVDELYVRHTNRALGLHDPCTGDLTTGAEGFGARRLLTSNHPHNAYASPAPRFAPPPSAHTDVTW